jgi:hypothetical protein
VRSADSSGNLAESVEYSFTTTAGTGNYFINTEEDRYLDEIIEE